MHTAVLILVFFSIGALLGGGYFALLFAQVRQCASGASLRHAVATYLLRLMAAVLLFWMIAQYGASALLASVAGFTLVLLLLRLFVIS